MSRNDRDDKKLRSETARALAQFSHVGVVVAASIFISVMIGRFLDRQFGTSPWLLLLFSILGVGAAFKSLIDISSPKKRNKDNESE
ncbi:AtpZ/AtpI family protein [Aerococcaceae bacterium WGS1372]